MSLKIYKTCKTLFTKNLLRNFNRKELLEKPTTAKLFEYLSLGSELKNQTCIAEKHQQKFDDKEPTIQKYNRANLIIIETLPSQQVF